MQNMALCLEIYEGFPLKDAIEAEEKGAKTARII